MQNAEGRRIRKTKSRIRPSGYLDFCFILLQLVHCLGECVLSCTTECYVKLFSISSSPLHTGFLCPSPKSMCIGTIIPTPSAHAVKPLWNESTNPSVIVAVNGLIGQNMKMQKWKMGYHRDCQKEPRRTPGMRRYVESQNLCQCLFRREHREMSIFSPR